MAVWAIAWAGSKPIASLVDGSLAGLIGYRATGILLALPGIRAAHLPDDQAVPAA